MTIKTSPDQWQALEVKVENIYRALGYTTKRDVTLGENQLDVVAERKVPGASLIKIVIECKFKERGSVSNQEVMDFCNLFIHLRNTEGFTSGALITNSTYSQKAQVAAAKHPGIVILNLHDLENQLLDVTEICVEETFAYESTAEYHTFIPISGFGSTPDLMTHQSITDVSEALYKWLDSKNAGFVTLLGDFGAGKTTVLRRLNYQCQKYLLERRWRYIPIFIPLRLLKSFESVDALILDRFSRQYKFRPSENTLSMLRNEGRLIFLLDGFDEIDTIASKEDRERLFFSVIPVITSHSPSILTCRDTYFLSSNEYNQLLANLRYSTGTITGPGTALATSPKASALLYQKYVDEQVPQFLSDRHATNIILQPLSSKRIDDYLSRHEDSFVGRKLGSSQQVRKYLSKIYDLSDLMTRPILLSMIVDTLLSGELSQANNKITSPATLYRLYTDTSIERESGKGRGRDVFSPRDRRFFCHLIATDMFEQGRLEASAKGILAHAAKVNRLPIASDEAVATDLRTCSFLAASGDGLYRYTHKSFMEFFVAQYVMDSLIRGQVPEIFLKPLPKEIVYFLAGFLIDNPQFAEVVTNAISGTVSRPPAAFASNLYGAVLGAGEIFENLKIRNVNFRLQDFGRGTWTNHQLERVTTEGCRFRGLEMVTTSVEMLLKGECIIEDCVLNDCKISTRWAEADRKSGGFTLVDEETINSGIRITNSTFCASSLKFRNKVEISNSTFSNTSIHMPAATSDIGISDLSFEKCSVRWSYDSALVDRWEVKGATFRDSFIVGFPGTKSDVKGYKDCRGLFVVRNKLPSLEKDNLRPQPSVTRASTTSAKLSGIQDCFAIEEGKILLMQVPEGLSAQTITDYVNHNTPSWNNSERQMAHDYLTELIGSRRKDRFFL